MTRPGAAALLSLSFLPVGGHAAVAAGKGARAEAIARARSEVGAILRASAIPGIAVAVVADNRTIWSEGFGYADAARHVAARPTTLFRIGSASKLLTATALVRLADRGVVDLDAPIGALVPEYTQAPVTFRQLAGHLGGLRHYGADEYVNTTHYAAVPAALHKFAADPLAARPGEKYAYSSYGYNLLGAALERAAKRDFVALVRREVLDPMGMRDTVVEPAVAQASRVARFYGRDADGKVVDGVPMDLSDRIPSGGYLSTAQDLARFAVGTLRLPQRVQALLFTSQKAGDGKATGVGLAWRIATDAAGRRYVHHGGDSVGGRAFLLIYPEDRVAVVLLANLSFAGFGEKQARAIAEPFLTPRSDTRPSGP